MAKLDSILNLTGSLRGLTIYKLPGLEAPVVRATSGPSKEDINTKPQYDLTRRNISETGGRGKAVSWLMKAFQPLKPLVDADTAGQLQRPLRAIQKGDTVSALGQRAVRFSAHPSLLEGFHLTRALHFDSVVRGGVKTQLNRATLQAEVELPALMPRVNFFLPPGYPLYRVVAVLGLVPDLVYGPQGYHTDGDYGNCYAQSTETAWTPTNSDLPPTLLSLSLPYTAPNASFSLVLSVAVQFGELTDGGAALPVRRRVGAARILAAG